MATLSDIDIDQLRALKVTQLRTAISNKVAAMSKAQLIRLILARIDYDRVITLQDNPVETCYSDRQVRSRLIVNRDVLGVKVSSVKWDYAYYDELDPRPVKEIAHAELDANDVVVSKKVVKYFTDGRQPVVREGS